MIGFPEQVNISHHPDVPVWNARIDPPPREVMEWLDDQGWVRGIDYEFCFARDFYFRSQAKAAMFKLRWG